MVGFIACTGQLLQNFLAHYDTKRLIGEIKSSDE